MAPLQGPWGTDCSPGTFIRWPREFTLQGTHTQGIHAAGNSNMPGKLLGLYILLSLLAFTTVRLLTCCKCNFLRSLLIRKWEQMSKWMSWNMGAGHQIKDLFCVSQHLSETSFILPRPETFLHNHNKNAQIFQELLFSTSPNSFSYKPATKGTSKSISQKEILFSYFFISAVDVFQRKIDMYRLFPWSAGNGSSKCN